MSHTHLRLLPGGAGRETDAPQGLNNAPVQPTADLMVDEIAARQVAKACEAVDNCTIQKSTTTLDKAKAQVKRIGPKIWDSWMKSNLPADYAMNLARLFWFRYTVMRDDPKRVIHAATALALCVRTALSDDVSCYSRATAWNMVGTYLNRWYREIDRRLPNTCGLSPSDILNRIVQAQIQANVRGDMDDARALRTTAEELRTNLYGRREQRVEEGNTPPKATLATVYTFPDRRQGP